MSAGDIRCSHYSSLGNTCSDTQKYVPPIENCIILVLGYVTLRTSKVKLASTSCKSSLKPTEAHRLDDNCSSKKTERIEQK